MLVSSDGVEITVNGAKQRALLTRLLVSANRPVATERLIEDLWGATPPSSARATLQSHISHLRRAIGERLRTTPGGYLLDVAHEELDAALFEAETANALQLVERDPRAAAALAASALQRWRGRPLADVDSPWAGSEVARLDELRLAALECELEARLALGEHAAVVVRAEQAVAEHPLRERLWALLMTALYRDGRQADALRAYDRLRRHLAEELGIAPSPDLQALERAVLAHDADLAAPSRSSSVVSNLPTALGELIGRDGDLVALVTEVRTHRLVTLTGVGGAGKTRLAVAIGGVLAPEFFDGAWLVELAPVADQKDVIAAVAACLSAAREPGHDALSSLLRHLADRRLLLVLDNCEHVLDEVAALVRHIAASAPDVHVLATSREALDVHGEVVRRVRSLDLPDDDLALRDAAAVSSVRLFVERAAAANDHFVLDETNVDDVIAISRRLDGVPLAIELAAARVRTMTAAEIARRLDDCFRLLTGARAAHERHRTMTATVAWSYDLLTSDERRVFAQLSVFPTTFDLRAASEVVRLDETDASDVVDVVLRLVDRSLVMHEHATGRYRLLETLRQYGADRLANLGCAEVTLERYSEHYARLVTELAPGVDDQRHDDAIATLAPELDNIRSAVDVLVRAGRWSDVGAVALAGWRFFTQFTPIESRDWLAAALGANAFGDAATEAEALAAMAMMAANVAAVDEATTYARRALDLAARDGFPEPPWARFALAMLDTYSHDLEGCLQNAAAAAGAGAARGDELARIVGLAQTALPLVRSRRLDEATAAVDEAVEGALRLRNSTALSVTLVLASAAYAFGGEEPELARARLLLDQHSDRAVGAHGGLNTAWLLCYRALAESERDPRRAIRLAIEAARIADRSSSFALACTAEVLALGCARAGLGATALALLRYATAQGSEAFDSSQTGWVRREVERATTASDLREVVVPRGRRELIGLLSAIEAESLAPTGRR